MNENEIGAGFQSSHSCHGNDNQGVHAHRQSQMLANGPFAVAALCITVMCSYIFSAYHTTECGTA